MSSYRADAITITYLKHHLHEARAEAVELRVALKAALRERDEARAELAEREVQRS